MKLLSGRSTSNRRFPFLVAVAAVLLYMLWPNDSPEPSTSGFERPSSLGPANTPDLPRQALTFARRLVGSVSTNLFASHSWFVAPPPPPASLVPTTPAAPTAPPLPYSLLGSYARAGDRTVFFLVKGDLVFDVHVGDTLENTYSVDGVANGRLLLTYLPLKLQQSLVIEENQ